MMRSGGLVPGMIYSGGVGTTELKIVQQAIGGEKPNFRKETHVFNGNSWLVGCVAIEV